MTAEELEASLDRLCELDEPAEEEDEDFEPFTAEELAAIAEMARRNPGPLDRASRLTPAGLRAAIARAVIEVAPGTARQRRETAAKFARVERWAEDTGIAALMGRELPPDQVLAADQKITAWAHELKRAGLAGGMDQLRARAYLDLLLGKDSRPRSTAASRPRRARPAPPCRRRVCRRARRDSPSPRPAGTGRPADTAPGGSAPRETGLI